MRQLDASDVLIAVGIALLAAFCLVVWAPSVLAFVGLVFLALGFVKVWRGDSR